MQIPCTLGCSTDPNFLFFPHENSESRGEPLGRVTDPYTHIPLDGGGWENEAWKLGLGWKLGRKAGRRWAPCQGNACPPTPRPASLWGVSWGVRVGHWSAAQCPFTTGTTPHVSSTHTVWGSPGLLPTGGEVLQEAPTPPALLSSPRIIVGTPFFIRVIYKRMIHLVIVCLGDGEGWICSHGNPQPEGGASALSHTVSSSPTLFFPLTL